MIVDSVVEHYDLALIVLYLFWLFFAVLVIYLNREGMREGYPTISEVTGRPIGGGLLGLPKAKTFTTKDGLEYTAPHDEAKALSQAINAEPTLRFPGAPMEPTGDPMLSAFGPGAYAERADIPARTYEGHLKIAPMRNLEEFSILSGDRDPRGLPIMARDFKIPGVVTDVWIDREEQMIRYLEVELTTGSDADEGTTGAPTGEKVLVPMTLAMIGGRLKSIGIWRPHVKVASIKAHHFANVPRLKSPDQITLLEEDKVVAYYGGGKLYADDDGREALV